MDERELLDTMEDLTDEEFKRFKWHLKLERLGNIDPLKAAQLAKADREETVDGMCQKYQMSGAVAVARSVLAKLSRNDLVNKLEPAGPSPAAEESKEKQLLSIRTKFIEKVSNPVLLRLVDKLLEREVLTDSEREAFSETPSRATRARDVIDTVRKKGPKASSILITVLCEEDKYLAKDLQLM